MTDGDGEVRDASSGDDPRRRSGRTAGEPGGGAPDEVDAPGRHTGPWEETYRDGTLESRGYYEDGEKTGEWRTFFRNGRVRAVGRFEAGRMHGEWTWYRESGVLLQTGGFRHGEKQGTWRRFTAEGAPYDEGDYDRGIRSGVWTTFGPDGSVARTRRHRGPATPPADRAAARHSDRPGDPSGD